MKTLSKIAWLLIILIVLSACSDSENRFGGLALYTLRTEMGQDPASTLDSVANSGYAYIEAAGYNEGKFYGMSPSDFKATLEAKGLKPVSTHQGTASYENIDQMIQDVKAAGFEYFVIPVPPMGMFKFDRETMSMSMEGGAEKLAQILDDFGKKCSENGLKLLYHNHDFEFIKDENGNSIIDYLLENCNPDYVNFQMDLFWVTKAGADPIAYFEKYPNRFKIWHVKDMGENGLFAPVGEGSIDFGKIYAQRELSGMKYYMVEQDMCFNHTPLEAIKISHDGLQRFGFR